MSANLPPDPYFSNINFNPSFFLDVVVTYLTEIIANTKYLKLIGGTINGFLGIIGKCTINNGLNAAPSNGTLGSNGTKLILTEGTASITPVGLGTETDAIWYGVPSTSSHNFYNGTTKNAVINSSGLSILSGSLFAANANNYFGAADSSGLRIGKNDIFTNATNGGGITIFTQNLGQTIQLGFFGGNGTILTVFNTYVSVSQTLFTNQRLGIGTGAIPNNVLQVGDGGRLRISNNGGDYTILGTKETDDANNTRLVLGGYLAGGSIQYRATTATGAHKLYLNNSSLVADIDDTDFTVFNSITTIGNNYYTDGGYELCYVSGLINTSGQTKIGYFISTEFWFSSLVNIAFSHNSTTYTYWHGRVSTNNSTQILNITNYIANLMAVEAFTQQTTNKTFLYIYPTTAYIAADQLRVKFYS